MPARTAPSTATPNDRADTPVARRLASTALIVLVLGVLPIAWHASVVWQIAGCSVAVALVAHTALLVWREVFRTTEGHPRRD